MSRGWQSSTPAVGLRVFQPRRGYRYSMDPILLAGWLVARGPLPKRILDVGSGSGILGLLLATQGPQVVGIDVQAEWLPWARRSAQESGLSVDFRQADVRDWSDPPVSLVVSNPPYFRPGEGSLPSDPMRAQARHGLAGDLPELVAAMARAGDRVALVLPSARAPEAIRVLAACGRPVQHRCVLERLTMLDTGGLPATGSHSSHPLRGADGGHSELVRACYAAVRAELAESPSGR